MSSPSHTSQFDSALAWACPSGSGAMRKPKRAAQRLGHPVTLPLARFPLLGVVEPQTDASQVVLDASQDKGDLVGAVRALAGVTPAARTVIAEAKGCAQ